MSAEGRLVSETELADHLATALRLTQEYVGSQLLPPIAGWSWFDALEEYYRVREDQGTPRRPIYPDASAYDGGSTTDVGVPGDGGAAT